MENQGFNNIIIGHISDRTMKTINYLLSFTLDKTSFIYFLLIGLFQIFNYLSADTVDVAAQYLWGIKITFITTSYRIFIYLFSLLIILGLKIIMSLIK